MYKTIQKCVYLAQYEINKKIVNKKPILTDAEQNGWKSDYGHMMFYLYISFKTYNYMKNINILCFIYV